MIGSFLGRFFILTFGYAYPAYECYKTVEKNKPTIDQLRFWCQYWILVALLTVSERFGDAFISWLPMYHEGKLAFYLYLWYPKTRGATYVYETFFRPCVAKHEVEIDRNLLELRARAGDAAVLYWNKAATYSQAWFFEIFQNAVSYCKSSKYGGGPAQKQHERSDAHQQNNAPSLPALVPFTKPSFSASGVRVVTATNPTKSQTCSIPADAAEIPPKNPTGSTLPEVAPSSSMNKPLGASASLALSPSTGSSKTSENDSKPSEVSIRSAPVKDSDHPFDEATIMEDANRVTHNQLQKARSLAAHAATSSTCQL